MKRNTGQVLSSPLRSGGTLAVVKLRCEHLDVHNCIHVVRALSCCLSHHPSEREAVYAAYILGNVGGVYEHWWEASIRRSYQLHLRLDNRHGRMHE
jgi:hypothetical protein